MSQTSREIRQLRAHLDSLEFWRQELAEQRTEAMMRGWDKEAIASKTASLRVIYEDYRRARAEFEAGGRTGPVGSGRKKRNTLTVVDELVADPLALFVRQCCVLRSDAVTRDAELKASYRQWAADVGAEAMSPHAVTKRLLRMRGVSRYRSHGRSLYRGISLREPKPHVEGATSREETEAMRIMGVK